MTLKQQKIISAFLIAIVAFGGFEALIYIVNLNQPILFVKAAFAMPAPLRTVAERTLFRDALAHADGQEGMAAFLSKRAPSFR